MVRQYRRGLELAARDRLDYHWFSVKAGAVQCIWRSHSRMLLTIRSISLVGFVFPRHTAWLWMKADARPGQWLALCRALRAHAQT